MAYSNTWASLDPTDATWAYQVDDNIRGLRDNISERLATVLVGWPDTDPLKLNSATLDPPLTQGATMASGLEAALPNPAVTDFYFATDSNKLFAKEGTTFTLIIGGSVGSAPVFPNGATIKKALYDQNLATGLRVTEYGNLPKILVIDLVGDTDAAGAIAIDLDEFSGGALEAAGFYTATNLIGFSAYQPTDAIPLRLELFLDDVDAASNSIYIYFKKVDESTHGTGVVRAFVTLFFKA